MSTLAELRALADADVAESGVDLNEAVKGGGGGRLLPAGYAFGRLVEYVEFGNQPQEYQGQAKDPALEFVVGFALWGQGYQNEDGTPYIVRTYNTALSRNEKSRAFKLFKALNWKGSAKGYAQLLGETFLVKIKHCAKSQADPTIVSRLDLDGFLPPLDPVTRQPYAIPEAADAMYRMFLWNHPTKAAWDSLFIDGQYDGKSKNRIQEAILGAVDFQGSMLQNLLMENGVTTLPAAAPASLPALPSAPAVPTTPASAPAALAVPSVPVAAVTLPPVTASVAPAVPAVPAAPAVEVPAVAAPLAVPAALAPAIVAPTAPALPVVPVPVPVGTTTSPSDPALPA